MKKQSSVNKKKKPRTQVIAVGGPSGGPDNSSSSSGGSSSLTSSVYSSTISSHLSGDEQMEKHHIMDVFANDDGTDDARTNPVPSAISELESESSSKQGDQVSPRLRKESSGLRKESSGKRKDSASSLGAGNEPTGRDRRSQSVNALGTSQRLKRSKTMPANRVE